MAAVAAVAAVGGGIYFSHILSQKICFETLRNNAKLFLDTCVFINKITSAAVTFGGGNIWRR